MFVKYVTDKFKGVKYADITVPEGGSFDDLVAIKGDKNIGEKMDKVISKLAEAENNNLVGVITNARFNDESKLGKGQEMVDKLTGLIAIFQRPEYDFKNNKAAGDDILGDAYEYLMRNFATESGKSKGQFYTPAEVSRVLAKVIGIDKFDDPDTSVYDPLMMGSFLQEKGIFPAYHMSKTCWISVLLDGTVSEETLSFLIDVSYELTDKKCKK